MEKELRPGRRTSASLLGKISVVVLKTLAALVLIALLAVFVTSVSPIYDFAEPRPFSGPDIFNPYRDGGDSAFCWKRANFHTHTRVKGILNECEHWPDETDAAYRKFGYDIVTFSNHNELTVHPYDPLLQVNVYEHGYNLFKYHKLVFGCSDVNLFDHLVPLFASQKQFQLDLLGKESDFIQMNHPLRTIGTSEDHMRKLGGYRIMELDSGKSKENEYWDWALSAGHYSFGLANDDLHFPDRSSAIAVRCNFLCCPSARYEDIRKTLLGGCYYAMRVPDYGRGDWEVKYERNRHLPSIERIGLDGQTVYIALSCPADSIKVTGQDHDLVIVSVPVDAALQARKARDEILESLGDIVSELFRVGLRVHGDDGFRRLGREFGQLRLDEFEVGHRLPEVELQGIGVQTENPDIPGREGSVEVAEDRAEDLLSGGQTVVVAQQDDVGNVQAVEDIALALELRLHSEVGHVARVEHEVDVAAGVQGADRLPGLVVPALRVGDHGEADGALPGGRGLDAGDVLRVDSALPVDAGVVWMVVHLAGCRRCRRQQGNCKSLHVRQVWMAAALPGTGMPQK